MQRVAVLSHVKASSAPPSLSSKGVRRIAWQGGTIVSNKEEALQKFYQRKLRAGDHLTTNQIEALQTLSIKLESDAVHKQPKKMHRPHAKVTVKGNRTVLKTGRVLGPKLGFKKKGKEKKPSIKLQAIRQPKIVAKMPQKRAKGQLVSLEDKLGLPLDALVSSTNKRSSNTIQR